MNNVPLSRDITRLILGVLFIGVLIAASFWILRPFLLALIWATMIVWRHGLSCFVWKRGWGVSVRSPWP